MSGNLHTLMLGRITVSRTPSPRPPPRHAVWAALEAAPRWPEVLTDLVEARIEPDGVLAEGAIIRTVAKPGTRAVDMTYRVVAADPRLHLAIESGKPTLSAPAPNTRSPAFATGARVTVTSAVEPVRWLHRITTALARRSYTRQFEAAMEARMRPMLALAERIQQERSPVPTRSSPSRLRLAAARSLAQSKHALGRAPMTIKRILPAILAAAFALVSAGPAQAEVKKGWIDYTHGTKKLKGYVVYDDAKNGKRPAILMVHAREGMTPKTLALTELWAKLGYVAFAADIFGYGEGVLPKNVEEMSAQTTIFRKDRPLTRARTQAGWDALVKHPLVDAGRDRADRLLLRRRRRRRIRLDRRAACAQCLDSRLVREKISGRMGEEREGPLPDPARRRGRRLSADDRRTP